MCPLFATQTSFIIMTYKGRLPVLGLGTELLEQHAHLQAYLLSLIIIYFSSSLPLSSLSLSSRKVALHLCPSSRPPITSPCLSLLLIIRISAV